MRFDGNASGRPRRLVLGMTMAAGLAVMLAACSGSGGTATPTATARKTSAAASARTPAVSTATPAAAAAISGLSGTWSGQYSGAYQGTFTLTWRQGGSKLSGSIKLSAPATTLSIHGTVQGGAISFGTVGGVGITYSGTVSGGSMSGTYQVQGPNGPSGGPWSASKS